MEPIIPNLAGYSEKMSDEKNQQLDLIQKEINQEGNQTQALLTVGLVLQVIEILLIAYFMVYIYGS